MLEIPTPSTDIVMSFLLGVLVGLPAPFWYAQERIAGFSRYWLGKLPYQPPPGKKEEQAMEDAVQVEDKEEEDQDEEEQ